MVYFIYNIGLLCDLLWSDPCRDLPTDWGTNERGVSVTFSKNAVYNFLEKNNLDLICRAHQVGKIFTLGCSGRI